MNSRTSFDLLAIAKYLSAIVGKISPGEVHLFAYLSYVLYLYQGNPSNDWGYSFVATNLGAPYSADLNRAIETAIRAGLVDEKNRLLTISNIGNKEFEMLSSLSEFHRRLSYIEATCSSVLAAPIGLVRSAVYQIPTMKSSRQLHSNRHLADETSLVHLQHQISDVRAALRYEPEDLLTPAVTWIMYFSQQDLLSDPS